MSAWRTDRKLAGVHLVAAALVLAALPAARADVIVVDPHGGPGGLLLQTAIDAAHDGDILLLKAGDYSLPLGQMTFVGCNSWVTIVPDVDAGDVVLQAIGNCGLSETAGTTVLRGLWIAPVAGQSYSWGFLGGALDARTRTWVEDCTVIGQDVFRKADGFYAGGSGGIGIEGRAVVTHCTIVGGNGCDADLTAKYFKEPSGGDAAVYAYFASSVILADSTAHGGNAGDGVFDSYHARGGDGLQLAFGDSCLWVSGCQLAGGNTGLGNNPLTSTGSGLAGEAGNLVLLRDSEIVAGQVLDQGVVAPDIAMPPGVAQWMPAVARSCHAPSPVRGGQDFALSLRGAPGDAVLLIVSTESNVWPRTGLQGCLALETAGCFASPPIALTASSGEQDILFRLPEVPGAFGGGATLFVQGLFAGADGVTLGAPTTLIWIGSEF